MIHEMMNMSCQFLNMIQTRTHWWNIKKEHHSRRRRSQKHHHNQYLKKEKTHKVRMRKLLGHVAKSLSIHDMEQKDDHHHMFDTVGAHIDEDC